METLKYLPEVSERIRGGVATLGYDRVLQIREEMALLEQVVAAVVGVPREQLTKADVHAFLQALAEKMALTSEDLTGRVERLPFAVAALQAGHHEGGVRDLVTTVLAAGRGFW